MDRDETIEAHDGDALVHAEITRSAARRDGRLHTVDPGTLSRTLTRRGAAELRDAIERAEREGEADACHGTVRIAVTP